MTLDPFIFLVIVIFVYYCLDKFWHYLIFNFSIAIITPGISSFVDIPAGSVPGVGTVSYEAWYQGILALMVLVGFARCFRMIRKKTDDEQRLIE